MSHVPPATRLPPRRAESRRAHRFASHLARRHRVTLAFVTDHPSPYRSEGQTLRVEMGENARSFVARHRTWEAAAQRLLSVVAELVRRGRAGLHPCFTPLVPVPRTG